VGSGEAASLTKMESAWLPPSTSLSRMRQLAPDTEMDAPELAPEPTGMLRPWKVALTGSSSM
jgi:hypothetical protein